MVRLSGYTGLMDQIRFDQHHIPRFHQIGLTFYEIIPLKTLSYLSSPAVAAATAIMGVVTDPADLPELV